VINEAMREYSFVPASEHKLTNPTEVQDAILGIKVGKAPGPNDILNRVLKHLLLSVVFPVVLFNTIFLSQYFTAAWKYVRVFSILKPGKDPALLLIHP
jgi:polyferredoxin